ncbi:hypothetical protein M9B39_02790 [SAR86 cluster bacterium]|jgi:hypothetical protein|nr:hypothetical protein M9B39_02790 [SAR86 cluster bacterium]
MYTKFSQFFLIIFLFGCGNDNIPNTEVISINDAFFFQKDTYFFTLINCDSKENILDFRKSDDGKTFLYIGKEDKSEIFRENCSTSSYSINQITTNDLLDNTDIYLDISMCTKNIDADDKEDFKIYLNFIDLNNILVFSAISQLDDNKYLWVNIWPSKLERLNSLDKLIKSPNARSISESLKKYGTCDSPDLINFTYEIA